MIEAPEALYLARQLNQLVRGKRITEAVAGYTPHKFTFYYGKPEEYAARLLGKEIGRARACGGMVEISVEDTLLVFSDGANLAYLAPEARIPSKYQLLVGFEDESCLVASVRMYGGVWCFPATHFKTPAASAAENLLFEYYGNARDKVQVMSADFTLDYFLSLVNREEPGSKSLKAFLATGQTIPGLGNGVLQDILFQAKMHPKKKASSLSGKQKEELYYAVKATLQEIYDRQGRNTETDLKGKKGNYIPVLCKDTAGKSCPRCGGIICKESYLGGSIYFCNQCQEK